MPNTKVTRQKWKDHLFYARKIYIFGALITVAVCSLLCTVTRHVPDDAHAVNIELVDRYIDPSKVEADIPALLKIGQEYDSSLEAVSFLSIAYSGAASEYEGSQVYTVQVYAGENDIFIQNELLTNQMYENQYLMPLETLDGFEEFNAKHPELVIWRPKPVLPEEKEAAEADAPADATGSEPEVLHAYALDVSSLTGFNQRGAIDIRGKYAVITSTSKNANTSFHVLAYMFEHFQPEGGE